MASKLRALFLKTLRSSKKNKVGLPADGKEKPLQRPVLPAVGVKATRVTQREVAREAKVSTMTVSLALRRHPSISEKTCRRIHKLADQLGYSPDPMLSALASYRGQRRPAAYQANIGWLSNHNNPSRLWEGDFALYYQGAVARARELGYVLEEISIIGEHRRDRPLRRLLDARNITGLLVAPSMSGQGVLQCEVSRYSVVRLGYSYRSLLVNTVANSQFRTALITMQNVIDLGYRRIGIILSEEVDERTSWHFLGGYLAGQHLLQARDRLMPLYVPYAMPAGALVDRVHDWIVNERIDCLLGSGHRQLYASLTERGMEFPRRLGYADTQIAEADTFFSGMHQNARQIGRAAVDLLVSMMHQHTIGLPAVPHHLLIEGSWHAGKTAVAQPNRKTLPAVKAFPDAAANFR